MFKILRDALRIQEIRRRILYVLLMLVVIRLGSQIPVPGVNSDFFKSYFEGNNANDAFNFLNAFTGGGFSSFSLVSTLSVIACPSDLHRSRSAVASAWF